MMRDWSYGVGGYPEREYHVHLIELPWWLWMLDELPHWIYRKWMWRVPLPRFVVWTDDDGEKYQIESLGEWMFLHVVDPLYTYVYRHKKRREWGFKVDGDELKKAFPDCVLWD